MEKKDKTPRKNVSVVSMGWLLASVLVFSFWKIHEHLSLWVSRPRDFARHLELHDSNYAQPSRNQRTPEKILRRIDDVYLIDSLGNVLISDVRDITEELVIPSDENYDQVLEGKPVFIKDSLDNKTTVMTKLNSLVDTYLYISRNIDPETLRYLNETEKAVSFYYSVENSQTGIKVTFAIIYIIVVTLLLFLSTSIAITFASRLTKPIINLIGASDAISKGTLDIKVPNIETDEEFKQLNNNFNSMIDRLKKQQDKLLAAERYEAWESVARKLAHEIKNPLTPIQLTIDRLKNKYSSELNEKDKENFSENLKVINNQIKQIEKLVNEFSDFARMPKPVMKEINLYDLIFKAGGFEDVPMMRKTVDSAPQHLVTIYQSPNSCCQKIGLQDAKKLNIRKRKLIHVRENASADGQIPNTSKHRFIYLTKH